ncbi:hypothetical protein [Kineosporia sp. NBRC 101731]|uniref:hypothetical protein n=1 Tax=Kineosporia sp. NBRC 101731 TaxID=3032199 RepID=UPI00249FE9DE|nr:hypothetical protein [Kineosporia sp. NBRC 101731]GLY29903.1 hypothetical protein Kisp02_32680 [Kineosporia sp. NBRC 101731]
MTEPDSWWSGAVGPEWRSHTWAAFSAAAPEDLVGQALSWAQEPAHTLYVRSASLRQAYGVALATARRAAESIADERGYSPHLFAVGVLDELSLPEDPDPAATAAARANPRREGWTSLDTRRQYLDNYAKPLERADLTLLRLPPRGDAERVLDQIADDRRNYLRPTVLAGVVLPHEFAATYGDGIATRFGFPRGDGTPAPRRTLTVLDLDGLSPA